MKKLEFKLTRYRIIMMVVVILAAIGILLFKVKVEYVNYIGIGLFVLIGILTYLDNKEENK